MFGPDTPDHIYYYIVNKYCEGQDNSLTSGNEAMETTITWRGFCLHPSGALLRTADGECGSAVKWSQMSAVCRLIRGQSDACFEKD